MASLPTLPPAGGHLIINADDLGADAVRDAVIVALGREGRISSASLLVTGENAPAAAAAAADLPLGLHLNLSEGFPLTGASSLTGTDGRLRGKFALRTALTAGAIAATDLAREIRAQFDRFIALAGRLPSHVDGHHHIQVDGQVAAVLAPIMDAEYGVYRLRLPTEAGVAQALAGSPEAAFYTEVAAAAAAVRPVYAACHILAPHAFVGLAHMGERLTAAGLAGALAAAAVTHGASGPLWMEWMVHPGTAAGAMPGDAIAPSPGRAHEAAVLASAELAAALAGWTRASFADMPAPDDGRPTLLVYGKLAPATGNAETARRLRAAWAPVGRVLSRPLLADPADPVSLAREASALRRLAVQEHLDLAFGIHVYRAGVPLVAAFAHRADVTADIAADVAVNTATTGHASLPRTAPPYGLLASGTDANADVQDPDKRAAMATALAGADFLLCLTDDLRQRLQGLPLPADTTVRPNGIDVSTASPYSLRAALGLAPRQRLVLFPATLRRIKGVLPLLQALGEPLATQHPDHVLVILGPAQEAAYASAVRATIADLQARHPNLRQRLIHHDGLPHADYLAALREAALVLNASAHEGLCHGMMEAMAAGIPVLASDIPGNRQLIRDDENGRLFASFAELPARYAACFSAAEATARMAATAREEIARRFSASAEHAALRAVLERSLARHPAGARGPRP